MWKSIQNNRQILQMADGVAIDKMFYLRSSGEARSLPIGTQLLLIDVTHGNKAYYYTVQSDDVSQLKFTDFKDRSGNAYVNQSINALPDVTDEGVDYYTDLANHRLTNVGIERFLLTVLSNDTDTASKVYTIHAKMQVEDENLASRFKLEESHTEESMWEILALPALKVQLKEEKTDIDGEISRQKELTVKATFEFVADDLYWSEKAAAGGTIIDSSNNGKYMEIAFYLRDLENNRVSFPAGTNFSYKLGDGSYSANKVISNCVSGSGVCIESR